jgi:hypothetical protein
MDAGWTVKTNRRQRRTTRDVPAHDKQVNGTQSTSLTITTASTTNSSNGKQVDDGDDVFTFDDATTWPEQASGRVQRYEASSDEDEDNTVTSNTKPRSHHNQLHNEDYNEEHMDTLFVGDSDYEDGYDDEDYSNYKYNQHYDYYLEGDWGDDEELDDDTVASLVLVTQKRHDRTHVSFERKAFNGNISTRNYVYYSVILIINNIDHL